MELIRICVLVFCFVLELSIPVDQLSLQFVDVLASVAS